MSQLAIPGQLNFLIEQHDAAFLEPATVQLQAPGGAKILRWGGLSKRLRLAADLAAGQLASGFGVVNVANCFAVAQELIDFDANLVKQEQAEALAKQQAERDATTAGGPIVLP
jgi:hypothetical protein